MVTRNGQPAEHTVPGFAGRLTRGELDAYNSAFKAIRSDFAELEKLQKQVNQLARIRWDHPANLRKFATLETADGTCWDAYGVLLKSSNTEVLVCRKAGETEWAAIQRFPADAQQHGRFTSIFDVPSMHAVNNNGIAFFADGAVPLRLGLGVGQGPPATGAHVPGEVYTDSVGAVFLCTGAGTGTAATRIPFHAVYPKLALAVTYTRLSPTKYAVDVNGNIQGKKLVTRSVCTKR